ncbi:MAG: tRNA (adenosine(37)-N6)-threonylcarbamoyltransferase complex dimerization subunit type 1 TsaB [Aerococcus sp.]|nr:tRNA (adenosine(37)-N6)-threonylcarbamoyltransferase complex dimerization subunit type 1 TsaB [Aerococcus sp.]
MKSLVLDTSDTAMSIALVTYESAREDGTVCAETLTNTKIKHSKQLVPLVNQLMTAVNWTPEQLGEVIVTKGPGSYTGLRIGVTFAKMLASDLDIALYSLSSLAALTANVSAANARIYTFFDARRRTVFGGAYQKQGQQLETLSEGYYSFDDWLDQVVEETADLDTVYFISPAIADYEDAIMARLGSRAVCMRGLESVVQASRFYRLPLTLEDADTFIPTYLKQSEAEEQWGAAHPNDAAREDGQYVEWVD